jgi:hypothetical protein
MAVHATSYELFARRANQPFRCPALLAKIFPFSLGANHFISAAVSSHQEGRLAIVTNAGRDAMDADVLLTNGTEADGEVVWF